MLVGSGVSYAIAQEAIIRTSPSKLAPTISHNSGAASIRRVLLVQQCERLRKHPLVRRCLLDGAVEVSGLLRVRAWI